jgi:hypothetical protein
MSSESDKCTPPATSLPESNKPEIAPFNNKGLEGKNDAFEKSKNGITITNIPTPRRRRTLKTARRVINGSTIPAGRRPSAYQRISKASQPIAEANRIVVQHKADRNGLELVRDGEVDLSDVQELRVKLIRRDKGIWSPHTDYLHRMERDILTKGMTKDEFKRRSATVLKMEQWLNKKFRHAEWKLARTGEWE